MELYRRNGDPDIVNNSSLHEGLLEHGVVRTQNDKEDTPQDPSCQETARQPRCVFAWLEKEWNRSAYAFSLDQTVDSEQDKQRFRCKGGHDQQQQQEHAILLDAQRMLAPQPLGWVLMLKTVWFVWSLCTFVFALANSPSTAPLAFFWAYLTRWGLTFSVLYLTCSWWMACVVWSIRRRGHLEQQRINETILGSAAACEEAVQRLLVVLTDDTKARFHVRPTRLVRATWFLGAMAYPLEVLIVVFFWSFDYKPSDTVQYQMVMTHGGIALMVIIDYVFVNQLPLRLRHFPAFAIFGALYTLWLLIFDLLPMGNPYKVENDDDAIYSVVQWTSAPCTTTLFALVSIFVLSPALFAACWWVSNYAAPALNQAAWSMLSLSDNANADDHNGRQQDRKTSGAFLFPMLPSAVASDLSSSSSLE